MKLSKAVLKQLEKHRDRIGKERDALRELQDTIQVLADSCDQGLASLEDAIEIFSQDA